MTVLGDEQLLLRMHTAFFQAGSAVVESNIPADRICIVVSGRSVQNLVLNVKHLYNSQFPISSLQLTTSIV